MVNTMTTPTHANALLLRRQLMELRKSACLLTDPVDGFSAGLKDDSNVFEVRAC